MPATKLFSSLVFHVMQGPHDECKPAAAQVSTGIVDSSDEDDFGPPLPPSHAAAEPAPAPPAAKAEDDDSDDFGPPIPAALPEGNVSVNEGVAAMTTVPAVLPIPSPAPAAAAAVEAGAEADPTAPAERPSKRRRLSITSMLPVFCDNLPSAACYEKSYMHRDAVTHVAVVHRGHFVFTGSADGFVKAWRKLPPPPGSVSSSGATGTAPGIDFVKAYRAAGGRLVAMDASSDGLRLLAAGADGSLTLFDVPSFDMVGTFKLGFTPAAAAFIYKGAGAAPLLAVADAASPALHIFNADRPGEPAVAVLTKTHAAPVCALAYLPRHDAVVSGDTRGVLDIWEAGAGSGFKPPPAPGVVDWKFKMDTDLYDLAKAKARPVAIAAVPVTAALSDPSAPAFAALGSDGKIRLFSFVSGKVTTTVDDSAALLPLLGDAATSGLSLPRLAFDETGALLLYAAGDCVKVVAAHDGSLQRSIGDGDGGGELRCAGLALYQGVPVVADRYAVNTLASGAADPVAGDAAAMASAAANRAAPSRDPTLFVVSGTTRRFYLFTRREPPDDDELAAAEASRARSAEAALRSARGGRDVLNEPPTKEEMASAQRAIAAVRKARLATTAVMHTTRGDITLALLPDVAPKAVENFCGHSRSGYYNSLLFHRVIKGFMIQTGDPKGDGTGGESIWGGEFEDEVSRAVKFDRPFVVAMANAGPGTNGSQFFITTAPCPWLDGKHTIFGRVTGGADVVRDIEGVKTNKADKPLEDIRIITIEAKS